MFQQTGRLQNLEQSKKIDIEIKDFLNRNGIYYGTYYHQTLDVVVNNIMTNLVRNKNLINHSVIQENTSSITNDEQEFEIGME